MSLFLKFFGVQLTDTNDLNLFKSALKEGLHTISGTALATLIWGMVTAVAMIAGGLLPQYVILINLTVYAASAQLTVLSMLILHSPLIIMWLAAVAVNLRFVIFSAGIRPYFRHLSLKHRLLYGFLNTDINWMLFSYRYRNDQAAPARLEQTGYFLGMAVTNYCLWQVGVLVGVIFASLVPTEWGLKLAGTLTLLALVLKAVNHWAGVAGCLAAAAVAVALQNWPYKLWVVAAIVAGVLAALLVEQFWPKAHFSASLRHLDSKKEGA